MISEKVPFFYFLSFQVWLLEFKQKKTHSSKIVTRSSQVTTGLFFLIAFLLHKSSVMDT